MQPTFFINHGGGPCFFLHPGPMRATWKPLEEYLARFVSTLNEPPSALLVISGHWEEVVPTVNVSPAPPLLFDYQGFPDYTYQITWPAPGAPEIAVRVRKLLNDAGIKSGANDRRGYDHGVFIPLKVAFPAADVPVVQLLDATWPRSSGSPGDWSRSQAIARAGRAHHRERADVPQYAVASASQVLTLKRRLSMPG